MSCALTVTVIGLSTVPSGGRRMTNFVALTGFTVIEELRTEKVPSVAVIVCDGAVFRLKPAPAKACSPVSPGR